MGRRSVCDPFDAAGIVERIATGKTTTADAWRAYATTVSAGLPIAVNALRNLKRGVSGHELRSVRERVRSS